MKYTRKRVHFSLHSRILYLYFSVQTQLSIFAELSEIQSISLISSQYVAIDSVILSLLSRLSIRVAPAPAISVVEKLLSLPVNQMLVSSLYLTVFSK